MAGAPAGSNHRSDVGRRVALRREQLGLTREDVARRAGIASEYLRYLETQSASPSIGSLTRVARALQTTVAQLSGVEEPADGPAPLGRRGEPTELGPAECRELLAVHSVGRVAVDTPDGPAIVLVTYGYVDGAVVFRAEPDVTPSFTDGEDVAFEVDLVDEALRVGWSVMLVGPASEVTDPGTIRRLAAGTRNEPWPGGDRTRWVRIEAERLSGRRVSLS